MKTPTKFTQEIKDNWLKALKSGKYIQGYHALEKEGKHCCIGVLGACTPGLTNSNSNPYDFLYNTISPKLTNDLWQTNDKKVGDLTYPNDYSNVIPLIEALPVQE